MCSDRLPESSRRVAPARRGRAPGGVTAAPAIRPLHAAAARGTMRGMKSYDVIRQAVDEPGVKAVAAALRVSAALVYKWCEPPAEADDPDQSGARNPLDRVRDLYATTKDRRLVDWLCHQAGGFFVANPETQTGKGLDESIFAGTRGMVRDFSELLDAVTRAHENDPGIDPEEADDIRRQWQDLKAAVEQFVIACEKGMYMPGGKKTKG